MVNLKISKYNILNGKCRGVFMKLVWRQAWKLVRITIFGNMKDQLIKANNLKTLRITTNNLIDWRKPVK